MQKYVAAPDNTQMVPIKHIFFEPFQTYVLYPDGRKILTGYGIGETINVMEPRIQLLVCSGETLTEIELDDGSILTNLPADIKLKRVWGNDGLWTGK